LLAIQYLHSVTWRRININSLTFSCEITCRTPSIAGCSIVLSSPGEGAMSSAITGTIEAIAPRYATVHINNVDPMLSYTFTASALVTVNRTITTSNIITGNLSALCKYVCTFPCALIT